MASISDVFDQIKDVNKNLGIIHKDLLAETTETTKVQDSVDNLDKDLNAGFSLTVTALTNIAKIDIEAVKLLFHLTQQADTMICTLEHISKNTCAILTQATIQTQLQTRIRDDADVLRDIKESEHPEAVLAHQRLNALRTEIERCCPPPKPGPACTYEPCLSPQPVPMPDLPKVDNEPKPPR